jgi:hypothetical protein
MPEADKSPRVEVVMPADVPGLISAMTVCDKRAAQLLPPVLKLVERTRSKMGATCPCCGGKIRGPFAAALIHRAGNTEPSLAATICADCAGIAEAAAAAGEGLARRMWAAA